MTNATAAAMTATTMTATTKPMRASGLGDSTMHTQANRVRLATLERVLKEQLNTVLTAGYFGVSVISLDVNDGTIMSVRHSVERMER